MIETERLRLRQFALDDLEDFYRVVSELGFNRYIPGWQPTREKTQTALARNIEHWRERGYGQWALERRASGEFLGYCGLRYLPDKNEVELLYGIAAAARGAGLVTEAAKASLRFGFEEAGLDEIIAVADPQNIASTRVMEKAGMRRDGMARYFDLDVIRYVSQREEYEPDDSLYILRRP